MKRLNAAERPRAALRSGLESLALRLTGLASTFLLGVVLARSLGPARYGIYGLVISVGALLSSICPLGTQQLAVREFAVRASRRQWLGGVRRLLSFQGATIIAWVALCVLGVAGWALSGGAQAPDLGDWTLSALMALALTLGALAAAGLRGIGAMNEGQVLETFGRPLGVLVLVLVVLVAAGHLSVRAVLWVQLAVAVAGAVLSQWWFVRRMAIAGDDPRARPERRPWLGQALPLGFVDAVRQFDATYALVMMGWFGSETEMGLFRVALACGTVANMAISIMHVVLAPRVSQLVDAGKRDELQLLLNNVSLSMIGISAATVIALLLFGRIAIVVAFGPAFAGAATPLLVLAIGQLCFGIFGMGPVLLAMSGSERPLLVIYAASAICGVASAVPLIHAYGAIGAALAQTVSLTVVGGLSDIYARRRLGVQTSVLGIVRRESGAPSA